MRPDEVATIEHYLPSIEMGQQDYTNERRQTMNPCKHESVCECEWARAETTQQDLVDNAVYAMLQELSPKPIEWDIDVIGRVRDRVEEVLVDRLHLLTHQQFYPYRILR